MSRQLPLQLLLLLLLCLLLLLHTHTYVFSKPLSASLFLEGDFLPEDKGVVLGVIEEEVVEANFLQKENCLSSCLGQLQPENGKAGHGDHQCGERSGARGGSQRWELDQTRAILCISGSDSYIRAIWCLFGDWYFSYLSIIFPKRDTTILSKPYPISCSTRVVAASFWGDMQTGYYRGIVDNIRLTEVGQSIPLTLQEFYPGWIFRLYVDGGEMKNETKQQLCEVSCSSDMWDTPV